MGSGGQRLPGRYAYVASYRAGKVEAGIGQRDLLGLDQRYLAAIFLYGGERVAEKAALFELRLMQDRTALAERRWLGMAALHAAHDGRWTADDRAAIERLASDLQRSVPEAMASRSRIAAWVAAIARR